MFVLDAIGSLSSKRDGLNQYKCDTLFLRNAFQFQLPSSFLTKQKQMCFSDTAKGGNVDFNGDLLTDFFSYFPFSFLIHHFNDFKLNAGFVFRRSLTLC